MDHIESNPSDHYEKLDVITTKNTLIHSFSGTHDKLKTIINIFIATLIGAAASILYWDLPISILKSHIMNATTTLTLLEAIPPVFISAAFCGGFVAKRHYNDVQIFKKLNQELGDHAVSINLNYEEKKKYKEELEQAIEDTCILKLQSQKEENLLETKTPSKRKTSEKLGIEKKQFNQSFLESTDLFLEEEIPLTKEKGPRLVKKRRY